MTCNQSCNERVKTAMLGSMAGDPLPPKRSQTGWALFDLDQTIVPWDLQVLFCNFILQREGWRRGLLLPFFLLLPLAKILGSELMKRVFMGFTWAMKSEKLQAYGHEFATQVHETLCYPEIVKEIEHHRAAGRTLVLISASPELYVKTIGCLLGFHHTFGTVVELNEYQQWLPRFPKGNNKSANKVVRLREELGLEGILPNSIGYSDSKADLPMLAMCEKAVAIHPEGSFAEEAKKNNWRVLHPDKPWRNRKDFALACVKMMLGIY